MVSCGHGFMFSSNYNKIRNELNELGGLDACDVAAGAGATGAQSRLTSIERQKFLEVRCFSPRQVTSKCCIILTKKQLYSIVTFMKKC